MMNFISSALHARKDRLGSVEDGKDGMSNVGSQTSVRPPQVNLPSSLHCPFKI